MLSHILGVGRFRARAIAVETARPGDVLVVAGRGHDRAQTYGARTRIFDDREVLRAALRHRMAVDPPRC